MSSCVSTNRKAYTPPPLLQPMTEPHFSPS